MAGYKDPNDANQVTATNAIGIYSKSGRYSGGTFAHKDIAFEFATWISAEFKKDEHVACFHPRWLHKKWYLIICASPIEFYYVEDTPPR